MRMSFYRDGIVTRRLHTGVLVGFICILLFGTSSQAATLESPARGAVLSGIGFISGWKCNARNITIRIDGGAAVPAAMRIPRADTQRVCNGATNNGFIIQMNWALLSDGTHTVVAYDSGVRFASATFDVTTFDEEFVEDAMGTCEVQNFPSQGETAYFGWNESTQHMELADFSGEGGGPLQPEPEPEPEATGLGQFVGAWRFTNAVTAQTYRFPRVEPCRGNTAEQCLYDSTQNAVLGTADILQYSYLLLHVDGPRCHVYFLREPQGGIVRGHYGSGSANNCASGAATDIALERYPTTGTRISAAMQSLTGDILPEDIDPEVQENTETMIEDLMDALMSQE